MSAEREGLERVARKLHEIELREGTATVKWDLMPEQHRDMYRKDAAEVLAQAQEPVGYVVRMRCDDMPWNYQETFYLHPHGLAEAEEDAEAMRHGPGDGWVVEVLPVGASPVAIAPEPEDPTSAMVQGFADAVKAKLRAANEKYGHGLMWRDDPNFDGMRRELREHMEKGDPRDVAAYCAFLWYHDESAASTESDTNITGHKFSGLTLRNEDGDDVLYMCLRDDTVELAVPDGPWHRANQETGQIVSPRASALEEERDRGTLTGPEIHAIDKAIGYYVKHNDDRVCPCRGCRDIRARLRATPTEEQDYPWREPGVSLTNAPTEEPKPITSAAIIQRAESRPSAIHFHGKSATGETCRCGDCAPTEEQERRAPEREEGGDE